MNRHSEAVPLANGRIDQLMFGLFLFVDSVCLSISSSFSSISKSADPPIFLIQAGFHIFKKAMKHLPLLLLLLLSFTAFSQTLDPLWLKQLASSQSGGGISNDEEVRIVKADTEGNIYVAGLMQSNGFIDTVTLTPIITGQPSYLAKFNCAGELLWSKQFGRDIGGSNANSIVEMDSIIGITLPFSSQLFDTFFIDRDTFLNDLNAGGGNVFVKYNLEGDYISHWGNNLSYRRGQFPNFTRFIYETDGGFCLDYSGQAYGVSFANDSGIVEGIQIPDTGTYLTKLTPSCRLDTIVLLTKIPLDIIKTEFFGPDELIIRFRSSPLPQIFGSDTFTSGGTNFIAKIDTLGNFIWANNSSNNFLLTVTKSKELYGYGGGQVQYDFLGLPRQSNGAYIGKIDPDSGKALWLTESILTGVSVGALAANQKSDGSIVWGGGVTGQSIFGPDTIQSYSNTDIWLSELTPGGQYKWTDVIVGRPSSSIERVYDIALDPADNIYFGGYFEGRFEYPSDTIFKWGGISDGFFAKLGAPGCFVCPTAIAQFSSIDSFLKVEFDASGSLEADSFFWDFDDGMSDTGLTPIHYFSMDGTYNVCLIAKSDCDADTICQMITVADSMVGINDLGFLELSVYPNPSRDGVFTVRTEPGLDGQMEVFDLSGREIYTARLSVGGQSSFTLSSSGVYLLRVETSDGTRLVRVVKLTD